MINEVLNSIIFAFNTSWNYLSKDLYTRSSDIVQAPFHVESMLWMLLPLLATLLLMEFYFGRYKDEELGWNTAFGNTLVLAFVAIDLFRHVYEPSGKEVFQYLSAPTDIKIIISLAIALLALSLMFIDFFHFLPKKVAYIVSSPTYVNLIGLLGIIVVYTERIPLNWTTVFACIVIFIIANLISLGLYYIIPRYKPTITRILTVEDVEKFSEELSKKKKDRKD